MSTMCHVCGSELTKLDAGFCCQICRERVCSSCESKEDSKHLVVDRENYLQYCKPCAENHRREYSKSNPIDTPGLSPAISLTSFDSCASSYGETITDINLSRRGDSSEGELDTSQNDCNSGGASRHSESQLHSPYFKNIEIQSADSTEQFYTFAQTMLENDDHKTNGVSTIGKSTQKMLESAREVNDLEVKTDGDSRSGVGRSHAFNIETDARIWIPPEPEDKEDEIESSVANNDDDDEYSDGLKWVPSTSLSNIDEEAGRNRKFKEERSQAIAEVVHEHFLTAIAQLLDSESITERWFDIVSSLSWEAANLIRPSANKGVGMDPTRYLKVKCISSGSLSDSQVVNGLVFKKNAAHKHMTTKYKSPKLLLLRGALGERDGLSSFDLIEQENGYLKSIIEMMKMCHPNIVLVEKTVSRNVQESLLAKGITLVFDMKLSRLEKIARCTGSQILSSDSSLLNPKLKQCDAFHIEKFLEEHNSSGEGGKRSSKTLMFFEGCQKPLGCTILLKGAHSDELKKIKAVVQQAVFIAYHFILDTSLLIDQRAIVCKNHTHGLLKGISTPSVNSDSSLHKEVNAEISSPLTVDIPISDESEEKLTCEGEPNSSNTIAEGNNSSQLQQSGFSDQLSPPLFLSEQLFLSLSSSLKRIIETRFPVVPSPYYQSLSSYLGFKRSGLHDSGDEPIFPSHPIPDTEMEVKATTEEKKSLSEGMHYDELEDNARISEEESDDDVYNSEKVVTSDFWEESSTNGGTHVSNELETLEQDTSKSLLGPQSILVFFSSRCILKGVVCKENIVCRMKYYGYFDVSLGRFLGGLMLNQEYKCPCGEPPEAHLHYYTHQNGRLTIQVKQLPPELSLPGEAEGKIWMWSSCLKCEGDDGAPIPTQRVVMSQATRGYSFGQILELCFSKNFAFSRSLSCGHSQHKDCLHFYGLGTKITMFRYSAVEIFSACSPPLFLEFTSASGQEWLSREAQDVLAKGHLLFAEVMNLLHNLGSRFSSSIIKQLVNIEGSTKTLGDIEDMLKQEKSEFEASLQKAASRKGQPDRIIHQVLGLNRLNHELLLALYVWDRRIHYLMSLDGAGSGCYEEQHLLNDTSIRESEESKGVKCSEKISEDTSNLISIAIESLSSRDDPDHSKNCISLEADLVSASDEDFLKNVEISESFTERSNDTLPSDNPIIEQANLSRPLPLNSKINGEDSLEVHHFENLTLSDDGGPLLRCVSLDSKIGQAERNPELGKVFHTSQSENSLPSRFHDPEGWVWSPFSESRKAYRKDLRRGSSQKFEFINNYTPEYLSSVNQLINQERSRLHFPVGTEDEVVSVYEDDITSIIACALALSLDEVSSKENLLSRRTKKENGKADFTIETRSNLISNGDGIFYSRSLMDLETSHLEKDVASGELSTSWPSGLSVLDPLHPEFSLGVEGNYSVVCIHAKQFYALRKRCCPSELDYISSLSRCKKWDAQGGKSKALFAKTLDDRFVVKEIKKTEFDSFLKFAPEYFNHITYSLSSGSQTCLAKILGVYQVNIRQTKKGRELNISVIVMENVLFGRNISRLYDLKGALHMRYTADSDVSGKVLLDQNFIEDMRTFPVYISAKDKQILQRAVWNDTSFLTSINVMDYSLLVGVDEQRREFVYGIIDYLRQYTWDKHLETWVKASLVVPKNSMPTVVSPKEYKKRFRKYMSDNFLTLPDRCNE